MLGFGGLVWSKSTSNVLHPKAPLRLAGHLRKVERGGSVERLLSNRKRHHPQLNPCDSSNLITDFSSICKNLQASPHRDRTHLQDEKHLSQHLSISFLDSSLPSAPSPLSHSVFLASTRHIHARIDDNRTKRPGDLVPCHWRLGQRGQSHICAHPSCCSPGHGPRWPPVRSPSTEHFLISIF